MQLSSEQAAATAIDDNLIVNAGAGSGKTTVITARYLRLLEEGGLSPEQIVAITFTRKAAREMRERIDRSLARLSEDDMRWKEARDQLISAPISTIHAFYARILKAFPVEAQIDPSFRVLDELEADIMLNEALAKVIAGALAENCPQLATFCQILGAQALEEEGSLVQQLRDIYQVLLNRGIPVEKASLSAIYSQQPDWKLCRDNFLRIIAGEERVAAELGERDTGDQISIRKALVQAGQILAGVTNSQDLVHLYSNLAPLTQLKGGRLKAQKEFVNPAVGQLRQLLTGALAPVLGEAALSLLNRLDGIFREIKARAGGLDYSDLQLAVWRLLENNPAVVSRLRHRYKTYMIDEFQDTDRLQHRIIRILVEEGGIIPPGRLYVVGDEKQSIYRFRGAEVRVFDDVRTRIAGANPKLERQITCNYRSKKPLIDLVNALFSHLLETRPIKYINLSAHRRGVEPCAELIACSAEPDISIQEAEAKAMADRIQAMVLGGQELTVDDQDRPRPVRYGDIAILIKGRTHLRDYEHHLRVAGIPYIIVGGVGFYQEQEILDIVNLLRVVNNLRDELALVSVLRSPLFALDDDSLFFLSNAKRAHGGSLLDHGGALDHGQARRLERARQIISRLREEKGRMELPDLLNYALDLTMFRELSLTSFSGPQRYANLEKLVALAEGYTVSGHTLTGFLNWLDFAATRDEAAAQIDSDESDAVRIMTVHASKGLEFPVVFLPVCSSRLTVFSGSMLIDDHGSLIFRYPWTCQAWEQAREWEKERELEEYIRLLYVAITRARDWLVAFVREPEQREESFNNWLQEFATRAPEHFAPVPSNPVLPRRLVMPNSLPDSASVPQWQPEHIFTGLVPVGSGKRTFRYYSISQFMLWKHDRDEFDRCYLSRWVDASDPRLREHQAVDWQHEPGGTKFGTLLHRALKLMDSNTNIDALLKDLIIRDFPDANQGLKDRVISSAKNLLEHYHLESGPPGDYLTTISEQEFYFRAGNALFHGLIDRVLLAEGSVTVIDYKSNTIPEQGIAPIVDAYTPQLRFYAMAAAAIFKRPARAYLQMLRLPPGQQMVEIPVLDLQELVKELEQFVDYCENAR